MYRIGLTGGIASGKSTVSSILIELGAFLIDADKIARLVVQPFQPAWQDIVKQFGQQVLHTDQTIDRDKLGNIIFKDTSMRALLDDITHPRIKQEVIKQAQEAEERGYAVVVFDIPLLIEVKWLDIVDAVWLVYVDESTQLIRLMQRNGYTYSQAQERIRAQMSLTEKLAYADVVIDNNQDVANTRQQVATAWKNISR